MPTFLLRVELHGATSGDYEQLHAVMAGAGFSRTITVGDVLSHLPTGEYRYGGSGVTPVEVCDRAQKIARQIKPNPAIIVTESAGGAGVGLSPVSADDPFMNPLAGLFAFGSLGIAPVRGSLLGNALRGDGLTIK